MSVKRWAGTGKGPSDQLLPSCVSVASFFLCDVIFQQLLSPRGGAPGLGVILQFWGWGLFYISQVNWVLLVLIQGLLCPSWLQQAESPLLHPSVPQEEMWELKK